MQDIMEALETAYSDYRQELAAAAKKQKPADGLFGIGHTLQDDPCHERLDTRIAELVQQAAENGIAPQQAAQVVRLLFTQTSIYAYPESARWMLYATERHALPLVPLLTAEAAAGLCREYEKRYKPWDRLPVQRELHRALKRKAAGR